MSKPVRIGRQDGLPRDESDYALTREEQRVLRDRNIRYAHDVKGWDQEKIARRFGLDPQLVQDILADD
jgi:hypothetical protein